MIRAGVISVIPIKLCHVHQFAVQSRYFMAMWSIINSTKSTINSDKVFKLMDLIRNSANKIDILL